MMRPVPGKYARGIADTWWVADPELFRHLAGSNIGVLEGRRWHNGSARLQDPAFVTCIPVWVLLSLKWSHMT